MTTTVSPEEGPSCRVPGCPRKPRNAEGFLCAPHWFQLPAPLRKAIWAAHNQHNRRESARLVKQALDYFTPDRTDRTEGTDV